MAQPSSTHERTHRSSSHHHHHRTISSTTLLLALSLILAVLAITLSIPSYNNNQAAGTTANSEAPQGILGYLTPRRAHGIVARESAVAMREAEVARREAEILAGSPAGIVAPPATACAPVQTVAVVTQTVTVEVIPTSTIVKEVVKEVEAIGGPPPPAWWKDARLETLHDREQRVSEREKEVAGREENIGKRETDAAKREAWIMEQLINLGKDKVIEEEVVYERRKPKALPVTTTTETATRTLVAFDSPPTETIVMPAQTTTVTVAMPSATRLAAQPAPQVLSGTDNPRIGRTTEVFKVVEETPAPTVFETAAKPVETVWMEAGAHDDDYERRFVAVDDEEEDEEDDEYDARPVKKVKRVRQPGVRMPNPPPKKKWAW